MDMVIPCLVPVELDTKEAGGISGEILAWPYVLSSGCGSE